MNSENKPRYAESVAIIGCADGPTSVFIVDENKKLPLKARIIIQYIGTKGKGLQIK